jgi:hypothetical protein
MYRFWLVALLVFLWPGSAHANYCGHLALGMMSNKYPCDAFLNEVNAARFPATGVLWDSSFGDNKECLVRYLNANWYRPHAIIVYLDNGAGRRNRTLEAKDFWPRLSSSEYNKLIKSGNAALIHSLAVRLSEIRGFFELYGNGNTQSILVPGLEDNYDSDTWRKLGALIVERWPYVLARNPEGKSRDKGVAWFLEIHGSSAKCSGTQLIANLDGSTLGKKSVAKWAKANGSRCFITLTWTPGSQGRAPNGKFVSGRAEREYEIEPWIGEVLAEQCG